VQAVLPHLKEGSSIINTTSINAYKGNASLIPYTSTKGAEVRLRFRWKAGTDRYGQFCDQHEGQLQWIFSSTC